MLNKSWRRRSDTLCSCGFRLTQGSGKLGKKPRNEASDEAVSVLRWRELLTKWNTEINPEILNFLRTNPLHMLALKVCIFVYDLVSTVSTVKLMWDTGGALEFVCPPPSLKMPETKT